MKLLRSLFYLALSGVLSWFLLVRPPADFKQPVPAPVVPIELAVAPEVVPPAPPAPPPPPPPPAPAPTEEPQPEPVEPEPEASSQPPAPEMGDPEGDEEETKTEPALKPEEKAQPEPEPEPQPEPEPEPEPRDKRIRREIAEIMASEKSIKAAKDELSGRTRRGLDRTIYSSARDQLAIARFFGERVMLIPRRADKQQQPHYYEIDAARSNQVVKRSETPPLDRYREYRDLGAYKYDDLPPEIRALRRKVMDRSRIFMFAAFISAREWALVMARRASALESCNVQLGEPARSEDDLRKVTMRYARLPGGAFDIQVTELLFADGTRWTHQP